MAIADGSCGSQIAGQDHRQVRCQKWLRTEDPPDLPNVGRSAEVRVCAGRAFVGEADHLGPKGRQNDGRQRHLGAAPGRRVHRVEVFGHRRIGPLVVVAAHLDQWGVADADAEDESTGPRFGEGPPAVGHRRRVSGPDVGYAAGDDQTLGGRKVDGALRERLSPERLPVPDRAVAEPLHLTCELALDCGGLATERTGKHADATGIDAVESGQAHDRSKSTAARGSRRPWSAHARAGSTLVSGW